MDNHWLVEEELGEVSLRNCLSSSRYHCEKKKKYKNQLCKYLSFKEVDDWNLELIHDSFYFFFIVQYINIKIELV